MAGRRWGLPRLGYVVRETLLWLAAAGGVVCILAILSAKLWGLTLIMFQTGSMSPGIPTGSLALVREIPAEEIRVGDILTVDRAELLPVTHRVTSVQPGSSAAERVITMRGDANDVDDPEPYRVERARILLGSVPELARLVVWLGHPFVLGGITLAASALVGWAFWPRAPKSPGPQPRQRGRRAAVGPPTALLIALLAGVALGVAPAQPAVAAPDDSLRVTSRADGSKLRNLEPGLAANWDLDIDSSRSPEGELVVDLSAVGADALGLQLRIRSCAEPWNEAGCASGERVLWERTPARVDGQARRVFSARTGGALWLRLEGSLLPQATPPAGSSVTLTAEIRGAGETIRLRPGQRLATTGAPAGPAPLGCALLAVTLGLGVAGAARLGARGSRLRRQPGGSR